jgi:uncharacterized membrane protein
MRNNRWLIGGLVLSVVFNLLLAGFVIGRLSGFGPPPPFGPDPTVGFVRLLGFLDDDRRAAIAPALRTHMSEVMPMLHKMRSDQHAVMDALTAEPFVPDALANALDALRTNLTAAQVASHRSFVAMAALLTPQERTQLAEAMRRGPHMHGRYGSSDRRDRSAFGMQPWRSGLEPPQEDRQ